MYHSVCSILGNLLCPKYASFMAQRLKRLPAMWETQVWSLGWEDPLEKEMAIHSSIFAWKIPWRKEPGSLQSTGSQRVGHDWATSLSLSSMFQFFNINGHFQENIKTYWTEQSTIKIYHSVFCISSVQSLNHVWLLATPWTAARQASLLITNSWRLFRLMSIASVMPANHLILCRPLLLPSSMFPSVRVFSNESVLRIRWPKYWSFSFSISPFNVYSGLISFRIDWFCCRKGPETGLLSNTQKWIVWGDTCADKARDFFGKGCLVGEQ